MGVFVFLPLVLPLTAWPIARLAQRRLHPRTAVRLLTAVGIVLAVCSTLCLALIMVVGTAQLPGNPLPDGWSDPEVREAVPFDEVAGKVAIPALVAVAIVWGRTLWRHSRIRRQAERALHGLPSSQIAVLPDSTPYAYALPSREQGRIVVSSAMLACLDPQEREALFAHERTHLTAHHHRFLLAAQLAARANPFLRPLKTAIAFSAERWADEAGAHAVGDRRLMARTVGKAALVSRAAPTQSLAGFAAPGPVPRRVQALLDPAPDARALPPAHTAVGLALWMAAGGTTASAVSSANATVALVSVLHAATPL